MDFAIAALGHFMQFLVFQQCSELVVDAMRQHGTKFLQPCQPSSIEKQNDGKLKVTWRGDQGDEQDTFDTVLMAIGKLCLLLLIGVSKGSCPVRLIYQNNYCYQAMQAL